MSRRLEKIFSMLEEDANISSSHPVEYEEAEKLIHRSDRVAVRYHPGSKGKISEDVDYIIPLDDEKRRVVGSRINDMKDAAEILDASIKNPKILEKQNKKEEYTETIQKYLKEINPETLIWNEAKEASTKNLQVDINTNNNIYKIETQLENNGSIVVEGNIKNNKTN